MLVEELVLAGVAGHRLEHEAVLLEHVPVQRLEARAVQEPPEVALPALDPPNPPEVDLAGLPVHRGHEPDDAEGPARAGRLAVGDLEAHPVAPGSAELDPVEVDVALVLLLAEESGLGRDHSQSRPAIPLRHRVRLGMQVGAVHRVHHVVDGVAVVAAPGGDAEHGRVAIVGELLGEAELRRLLVKGVAEPGEYRSAHLAAGIAADRGLPRQGAGIDGRDVENLAPGVDLHPVIPARQPIAEIPAEGEAGAPVGAAVLEGVDGSVPVTPHDDAIAETGDPEGVLADLPARSDRIPEVAKALLEEGAGDGLDCRVV